MKRRPRRRYYVIAVSECPTCKGSGRAPDMVEIGRGKYIVTEKTCSTCGGSGEIEERVELWQVLRNNRRVS